MKKLSARLAGLVLVAVLAAGEGPVTVPDALERAKELQAQVWSEEEIDEIIHSEDARWVITQEQWASGVIVLTGVCRAEGGRTYQVGIYRHTHGQFTEIKLLVSKKQPNVHSYVMLPKRETEPARQG